MDMLTSGPTYLLDQACSTSYVMRSTLAKFGLNADNTKFNTLNYECINMRIIKCIIALFVYTASAIKT
jgi:hypothetical protein